MITIRRPAPPLPHFHLSEETANAAAVLIRNHVNTMLTVSEDIVLGRDSEMFIKVALGLLMTSLTGSIASFFVLGYFSLVIVLTVPAVYERYEEEIDAHVVMGYRKVQQVCVRLDREYISKVRKWILEKKKLS